ncbi:MAG TPA: hypothetical protein VJN20_11675 [Burkholderiales bacterium]|nr:hypothetical protein [Burkholderiales bacterium]
MKKSILLAALLAGCAAGTFEYREPPSEAQMAAIKVGMTSPEVAQALGGPPNGGVSTFRSGETVEGWMLPVRFGGIRAAYFNVHYRDGKVVRTSESYDYLSVP